MVGTGLLEVSIIELGLLCLLCLPGLSKVLVLESEEEVLDEEVLETVLGGAVGISELLRRTLGCSTFILSGILRGKVRDLNSSELRLDPELVLVLQGVICSSLLERELCLLPGGVTPGLLFRWSLRGVITVRSSLFLRFFRFFMLARWSLEKGDSDWSVGCSILCGFIISGVFLFLFFILSFMFSVVSQSRAGLCWVCKLVGVVGSRSLGFFKNRELLPLDALMILISLIDSFLGTKES